MKFNLPINNFTSGEWSPKMSSRTDTEQYVRSCKEITNMFVQMHGGVQHRGGTKYVTTMDTVESASLDDTSEIQSIPYEYGTEKIFLNFLRKSGSGSTEVTINHIEGTLYSFTGAGNGAAYLPGYLQYAQLGIYLIITDTRGTNAPLVFYLNNFFPSIGVQYELTPYNAIAFAGAGKAYKRLPWTQIEAKGSSVTMTHSGATAVAGACTITASAAYFTATDIGRYIRLCSGTSAAGVMQINAFTSTTVVTGTVVETIPAVGAYGSTGAPTTFWQITEWGSNAQRWPKSVTGFEQRLIFGGTETKPMTLWGSRIGNIFDFEEVPSPDTTGVYGFASGSFLTDNSRPFALTPTVTSARQIKSLSAGKTLEIHTDENEIVGYGTSGALGPINVAFESSTSHGGNTVMPVRTAGFSTFVQAGGVKIRDMIYNDTEAAYKASDLSFTADHFFISPETSTKDEIINLTKYQSESTSYLIAHTRSGKVYYVSLDRDYQINAWGRLYIAPSYGGNPYTELVYPYTNQAKVLQVLTLNKKLYFFVSRTNSYFGQDVSIEVLSDAWETTMIPTASIASGTVLPVYLDCASTYTHNTPQTTMTVDNVYRNQLVSVVADNAYIGELTVSNSAVITLPKAYKSIVIGFRYHGVVKPSPPQVGGQIGTPVGRIKRIDELAIKFVNTNNAKVGFEGGEFDTIPFRENSEIMSEATSYKTVTKIVNVTSDYSREPEIIVKQDKPYPMYIASIAARGVTYD